MLALFYILAASIFLPLIAGLVRYRSQSVELKVFSWLIFIGVLNELASIAVAKTHGNNLFLGHFYTIAELLILTYFFSTIIPRYARPITIIAGTIGLISVGYAINGNNLTDFNSIPHALECVFVLILTIISYYKMAVEGDSKDPINNGVYFVLGGLLFYFSAGFIIFTFSSVSIGTDNLITLYIAHGVVNAISNLIYSYGLWISKRSYTPA